MKLYVVRHGQTDYNIDNKVCGISNVELTDLGKQQAIKAREQLEDQKIDYIFASPLQRAYDTAKIINAIIAYFGSLSQFILSTPNNPNK